VKSISYTKKCAYRFTNCVVFVETSYLNTNLHKFQSSQSEKGRAQSTYPLKLPANLELLIASEFKLFFCIASVRFPHTEPNVLTQLWLAYFCYVSSCSRKNVFINAWRP